ncbi:hypothetical protein LTR66_001721 [Elasticomyces elasticus]|nr:hypothetical protein LTR66_001721 [Elasticomyces elasticus]
MASSVLEDLSVSLVSHIILLSTLTRSKEIIALTRPASVSKPINKLLEQRGVRIVPLDLTGPYHKVVEVLKDVDVVVSAIGPREQLDQIPLATAAKEAGVQRFVPCGFITVCAPGGIMMLRDQKEEVYNHIKHLRLPYTIVDVGWWYQIMFPRVPSGKVDYAISISGNEIAGDGNVPSAITDLRDIGRYIACIIKDDRTLNKMIMAYNIVMTPNEVCDLMERLSGEKVERSYISEADIRSRLASGKAELEAGSTDYSSMLKVVHSQYLISWGIRGDNTPEDAKYLGYLTSKDLYPDMKFTAFEEYLQEVLEGKAKGVYEHLKGQMTKARGD